MNFSLYVLGTPNGYDQYPLDSSSAKFQTVLTSCESDSQLSVFRDNQLVQYVYVRRIPGRDNLYLGFALVVTGVYCRDCKLLNDLFDSAFYDVLLKGELICYDNGNYRYLVERFAENQNEIKRIDDFFKTRMDRVYGGLFVTVPVSFQKMVGQCTVSINDDTEEINSAIARSEVVHIIGGNKSVLEFGHNKQSLSDLNEEYSKIQEKYKRMMIRNKNPKPWVIGVLIAMVSVSIIVITSNIMYQRKAEVAREDERLLKLKEDYLRAIDDFDFQCDNIVLDKDLNVGAQHWVITAFKELQIIEQCETDPLFSRLGNNPVFEDKRQLYRKKLVEAKNKIYADPDINRNDFDHGVSNPFYNAMRERLRCLDDFLEKSNGKSVLNVQIKVPNNQ